MALMTPETFLQSLVDLNLEIYLFGKKIDDYVNHPIIRPSINCIAMTYELAQRPEHDDLMLATSHLTGKKINRFTHIHQSTGDLSKKVKMLRLLGQKTGSCFQRCVGMDAVNALYSVTWETDRARGTDYHGRFTKYLRHLQENDLVADGAMTDPKGDRSLPPHRQADPDVYVHVVEKRREGIVVRGAKAHQTGACNSHEIIVMPTVAMREGDEDFAVSFACPANARGVYYIYGRQSCDTRKLEMNDLDVGNPRFGGQEALMVFDDVFVPWDHVFLCGEVEFSGALVERFAGFHRQSYGGCKVGVGDVLIGAAALAADMNGVSKASHIKDKLIEMIHLNETLYSCGLACSCEGYRMPAGNYQIDMLLANVCKQNVTRFPYEIARLAEDIAGGLMVTMPSAQDLADEKIGPIVEKFLVGQCDTPAIDRMRTLRLIENLTLGTAAVGYRTESMHGAGSPQAQRVMIARQANIDRKKELARELAGVGKTWEKDKIRAPGA
ncbi:MAG: 4-hydroxyphenylacetate 3-hydroxylase family protein [Deltaproteobacteria bacterium]|nr:4-hydroxyphenylacetate 3-hydroxylase family protein [Deltaproteobacteria bacterium]